MSAPKPASPSSPPAGIPGTGDGPRVWALDAYRAGERTQILALAEALGWAWELKHFARSRADALPGLFRRISLAGIQTGASSLLEPPWPDLVISAGMRNEPIARWIRAQSGGRTKLVWIGRPWAPIKTFDLIVTTPQYRLPRRDNVLENIGTLHIITPDLLAAEAAAWHQDFDPLPRPLIGVIAGGDSGPYTFGPRAARALGSQASKLARTHRGAVIATTSPRTRPAAADALAAALDGPHFLHRWDGRATRNPYLAILGAAERFIVTSDTVSMLSEAAGTGKPVDMFDLDPAAREDGEADFRLSARLYRGLMRFGPLRATRDLQLFHQRFAGQRDPADVDRGPAQRGLRPLGDLERAVTRVRRLLGEPPPGPSTP
jgi:mitochondrial fission protein ELM1